MCYCWRCRPHPPAQVRTEHYNNCHESHSNRNRHYNRNWNSCNTNDAYSERNCYTYDIGSHELEEELLPTITLEEELLPTKILEEELLPTITLEEELLPTKINIV